MEAQTFYRIFGKNNYIMLVLSAKFLLIGLIVSFGLEHAIRWTGQSVSFSERLSMIVFWPIMAGVFIFNFVKSFLND